jgi:hypothetical integral membrane protein (TIGR02206 family)
MILFGGSHLAMIGAIVFGSILLSVVAQRGTNWAARVGWFWTLVLILNYGMVMVVSAQRGKLTWDTSLPMQLCDWATVLAGVVLVTRLRWSYELAYFWGLAGTLQAVLTPDLALDWPDPLFIGFFVSHGGILLAVAVATFGYGLRPTWGSLVRAFGWAQVYLLCAGTVNWITGGNYGYLAAKPAQASLLDYLGPWPWYIISLEVVGLLSFVIYYLPWAIYDALRPRPDERKT